LNGAYHFLQGEALGLGNEEPDKGSAQGRQATEKDISAIRDLLEHIGRDLADNEVVHPVARCAEGHTVRSGAEGPDLGDKNPRTRLHHYCQFQTSNPSQHEKEPKYSQEYVLPRNIQNE
jgi:hypothetical protein